MTLVSHAAGRRLEMRCRPAERCRLPFTRLLGVAAVGLLGWTVLLGLGLPRVEGTRLLWVGFDSVEVAALAVTIWAVYRSRPLAVPAALVAGTLFLCDAWFDVVLSWGTPGWWWSVAGAVVLELPFTALLWTAAGAMADLVRTRDVAPVPAVRTVN